MLHPEQMIKFGMNAMESFELATISHVQNFGWECNRKQSVGDSWKMSLTEFSGLDTNIMSAVSQFNQGYITGAQILTKNVPISLME